MKKTSHGLLGLISIMFGLVTAFVLIPVHQKMLEKQIDIVRVKSFISKGEPVSEDKIEVIKISAYNVSDKLISDIELAKGKYAKTDLYSGSYINVEALSDQTLSEDTYLTGIPEDKLAVSVTVQTFAAGLSSKLLKGDIVTVITKREEDGTEIAETPPALNYVEVLSTTNEGGDDKEKTKKTEKNEKDEKAKEKLATVTLLVTTEQAEELVSYENKRAIHLALKCRGDEILKKKFLDAQTEYLEELKKTAEEEEAEKEKKGSKKEDGRAHSEETGKEGGE